MRVVWKTDVWVLVGSWLGRVGYLGAGTERGSLGSSHGRIGRPACWYYLALSLSTCGIVFDTKSSIDLAGCTSPVTVIDTNYIALPMIKIHIGLISLAC